MQDGRQYIPWIIITQMYFQISTQQQKQQKQYRHHHYDNDHYHHYSLHVRRGQIPESSEARSMASHVLLREQHDLSTRTVTSLPSPAGGTVTVSFLSRTARISLWDCIRLVSRFRARHNVHDRRLSLFPLSAPLPVRELGRARLPQHAMPSRLLRSLLFLSFVQHLQHRLMRWHCMHAVITCISVAPCSIV